MRAVPVMLCGVAAAAQVLQSQWVEDRDGFVLGLVRTGDCQRPKFITTTTVESL